MLISYNWLQSYFDKKLPAPDELSALFSRHVFEVESDQKVKSLTAAVEPIVMVILGLGVGFLVIAIILPIYNLTSQF